MTRIHDINVTLFSSDVTQEAAINRQGKAEVLRHTKFSPLNHPTGTCEICRVGPVEFPPQRNRSGFKGALL